MTAPAEPPVTADPVTDDATEPLAPVADAPATPAGDGTATGGETAPPIPADEVAAPATQTDPAPPPPGDRIR